MTIPKTRTGIDPGLSLHFDVHLTLVATVDTNTLPESAKLTKRSVTSVAKKDILHLFVIPDLSLPQGLTHLCSKAMASQSHNNTNRDLVLMKMIIQIFNLNVTLLTLSQRDIAICLNTLYLMKSQA